MTTPEIPCAQPAPADNGGSAFPYSFDIEAGSFDPYKGRQVPENTTERYVGLGMSLRDYFAAKAMYGMYAAPQQLCNSDGSAPEILTAEWIAKAAYETADAMLRARGGAA